MLTLVHDITPKIEKKKIKKTPKNGQENNIIFVEISLILAPKIGPKIDKNSTKKRTKTRYEKRTEKKRKRVQLERPTPVNLTSRGNGKRLLKQMAS